VGINFSKVRESSLLNIFFLKTTGWVTQGVPYFPKRRKGVKEHFRRGVKEKKNRVGVFLGRPFFHPGVGLQNFFREGALQGFIFGRKGFPQRF